MLSRTGKYAWSKWLNSARSTAVVDGRLGGKAHEEVLEGRKFNPMSTANQLSNIEHHDEIHVIFVGEIEEKWREDSVKASEIMQKAGVSDPSSFILEALNRKGGDPVAEFKPGDSVDLDEKDRKFFRITPGGGGRS